MPDENIYRFKIDYVCDETCIESNILRITNLFIQQSFGIWMNVKQMFAKREFFHCEVIFDRIITIKIKF